MSINIQHVLSSFQGSLSLNLRILREIYGVRFFEINPRSDALLACSGRDGKTQAPVRLNCDNAITPYTLLSGCWQPEEFAFVQRVEAILDRFPNKCFLTSPGNLLTTKQIMEFMAAANGKSEDFGFWR